VDEVDDDMDNDGQVNDVDDDDDNDGVPDSVDVCPTTPLGKTVDDVGCLACDVWDEAAGTVGRDGCVSMKDILFITQRVNAGFACPEE
jgi:hypothetical protein